MISSLRFTALHSLKRYGYEIAFTGFDHLDLGTGSRIQSVQIELIMGNDSESCALSVTDAREISRGIGDLIASAEIVHPFIRFRNTYIAGDVVFAIQNNPERRLVSGSIGVHSLSAMEQSHLDLFKFGEALDLSLDRMATILRGG